MTNTSDMETIFEKAEVKPLTIAQLMEMEGLPVFFPEENAWAIVHLDYAYADTESKLTPFVRGWYFNLDVAARDIKVYSAEDCLKNSGYKYSRSHESVAEKALRRVAVDMVEQQVEMMELYPECDGLNFHILCSMCKNDSKTCDACPNAKSVDDCKFAFDENKAII